MPAAAAPSAHDPGAPADVAVKVCGLKSLANALESVSAGARWIGLNFHPPSPRYVEEPVAAQIVAGLPAGVEAVGIFVNRPPAEVRALASRIGLRIVQLSGDEPPEHLLELGAIQVVRAFALGKSESIERMVAYLERARSLGRAPQAVLVDASVHGKRGGTGHLIDEGLLDALPPLKHLILSGGLTPENVGARVRRVRPWMVDVASGVESASGQKDPARVAAFVRAVRQATHGDDLENCG
jgi:phosphoribosylanthranilate isomerase